MSKLVEALQDRYVIERELGRGGMAIVYLARDLRHDRYVALKTLRPELIPAVGPERFLREIQIAARLQHPNILSLHDSGEANGLLYYVMPYVEGESLRQRLEREGQLPIEDALSIASEVASALAYAHSRSVLHRDIKPENILLSGGHAVVADFGIARAITEAGGERLTETGLAVGTAAYMSPEQAAAEPRLDGRTDVYSLGCVLYEMLAGQPPFVGSSVQAVIARKLADPVPPLRTVRESVPPALHHTVHKALARSPADRFPTAAHFVTTLEHMKAVVAELPASPKRLIPIWSWVRMARRPAAALLLVVIAGLAGIVGYLWCRSRASRTTWARTVALPEAVRLNGEGRLYQAFRLLREAQTHLPDDPTIRDLMVEWTGPVTVSTTPLGARVYVRDFFDPPDSADLLGSAPLKNLRLPLGHLVWRISAPDFEDKEVLEWTRSREVEFSLSPEVETRPGMVYVERNVIRLPWIPSVELSGYWIDKYEVTNAEYLKFITAGGYNDRQRWRHTFLRNDRALSWEEARPIFRDRTGRPGPATWELGTYPEGQGAYPVAGVSWYEAAAYCETVGKQLPTLHHWYNAADVWNVHEFARYGNFESKGPLPVGNPLRLGSNGTYDMAGNVKEWIWNEATPGRRYLLGGGWNEASYQFTDYDAQRPLDRQPTYGFRCATYRSAPSRAALSPVKPRWRDYSRERPADDARFAVYKSLYQYDRVPLEAGIDSVVERFGRWSVEHVSFAAAHQGERVHALLYLPRNTAPPYQTVLYFPGISALRQTGKSTTALEVQGDWFLFLVRSGRAVILPLYEGGQLYLPHGWRDVVIRAVKDARRAIDYVGSRPDLDPSRIAYLGLSMGASIGPIVTVVEPRFKASALVAGALLQWRNPPETESFSFLPRVKIPTLMINGRHDYFFPYQTSQLPMFRLLGTSAPHKRHRVFESGHVPLERNEAMKEILDWFDRYLGPVGTR